jgi:hypothetical protein
MRLKHMVKDKINYRATGKRSALTRQTNQGRANDGGLRLGEMERDGIMAHGMSGFLNESYMVRGDQYYMAVCNKTGAIAVYNPERNLFLSPFADGPLVFSVSKDGDQVLDAFSFYGRSFSLLRIPYALKLLIQELQVMNIQMRIITEDNIDQLLNLSYQSRNIDKLLGIDNGDQESEKVQRDIKEIIENYKKDMGVKAKVIVPEAPKQQQQQQQQQANVADYGTEVLKPRSPAETTTFKINETVVVKNEETRQNFPATVINVSKNDQGEELYDIRYFDDEEEYNVDVKRIKPYEQKNAKPGPPEYSPDSPIIPRSPEESPPVSPVYSPISPVSPPVGILDKANNALNDVNSALGNLGESISDTALSAVSSAEESIKEGLTGLADMIPGASPESPQSGGGTFGDYQMNQMFNRLSPDKQRVLMQLGAGQRQTVMSQIMNESMRMQSQNGGGGLTQYFGGLPVNDQLRALQRTYSQKAGEFGKLASVVNAPKITTIKPHSAAEDLYGGSLNLFKPIDADVEKKGGNSLETDDSSSSGSSSSSSGGSSSDSNIKKIIM